MASRDEYIVTRKAHKVDPWRPNLDDETGWCSLRIGKDPSERARNEYLDLIPYYLNFKQRQNEVATIEGQRSYTEQGSPPKKARIKIPVFGGAQKVENQRKPESRPEKHSFAFGTVVSTPSSFAFENSHHVASGVSRSDSPSKQVAAHDRASFLAFGVSSALTSNTSEKQSKTRNDKGSFTLGGGSTTSTNSPSKQVAHDDRASSFAFAVSSSKTSEKQFKRSNGNGSFTFGGGATTTTGSPKKQVIPDGDSFAFEGSSVPKSSFSSGASADAALENSSLGSSKPTDTKLKRNKISFGVSFTTIPRNENSCPTCHQPECRCRRRPFSRSHPVKWQSGWTCTTCRVQIVESQTVCPICNVENTMNSPPTMKRNPQLPVPTHRWV